MKTKQIHAMQTPKPFVHSFLAFYLLAVSTLWTFGGAAVGEENRGAPTHAACCSQLVAEVIDTSQKVTTQRPEPQKIAQAAVEAALVHDMDAQPSSWITNAPDTPEASTMCGDKPGTLSEDLVDQPDTLAQTAIPPASRKEWSFFHGSIFSKGEPAQNSNWPANETMTLRERQVSRNRARVDSSEGEPQGLRIFSWHW